jgi:hypothetical protein
VTNDDLIFRHRARLFARAGEIGVAEACRSWATTGPGTTAGSPSWSGRGLGS